MRQLSKESTLVQKTVTRKKNFDTAGKSILHKRLVGPKKMSLPIPCIELDIMKQFAKALHIYNDCYLSVKLSQAKLNEKIFVGLEICKLLFDCSFEQRCLQRKRRRIEYRLKKL